MKSSGSGLEKTKLTVVRTRCADHAIPIYPQKLALTSSTSGGSSIGIVRLRTKSHGVGWLVGWLGYVEDNIDRS
jgi:hypothetical protein